MVPSCFVVLEENAWVLVAVSGTTDRSVVMSFVTLLLAVFSCKTVLVATRRLSVVSVVAVVGAGPRFEDSWGGGSSAARSSNNVEHTYLLSSGNINLSRYDSTYCLGAYLLRHGRTL